MKCLDDTGKLVRVTFQSMRWYQGGHLEGHVRPAFPCCCQSKPPPVLYLDSWYLTIIYFFHPEAQARLYSHWHTRDFIPLSHSQLNSPSVPATVFLLLWQQLLLVTLITIMTSDWYSTLVWHVRYKQLKLQLMWQKTPAIAKCAHLHKINSDPWRSVSLWQTSKIA